MAPGTRKDRILRRDNLWLAIERLDEMGVADELLNAQLILDGFFSELERYELPALSLVDYDTFALLANPVLHFAPSALTSVSFGFLTTPRHAYPMRREIPK